MRRSSLPFLVVTGILAAASLTACTAPGDPEGSGTSGTSEPAAPESTPEFEVTESDEFLVQVREQFPSASDVSDEVLIESAEVICESKAAHRDLLAGILATPLAREDAVSEADRDAILDLAVERYCAE